MFHKHNWELVSKEFVKPVEGSEFSLDRGTLASFRLLADAAQGYYSYVFKCPCGAVNVTRS